MGEAAFESAVPFSPMQKAPARVAALRAVPRPKHRIDGSSRPLRIALYSHDTLGLGHTRRNLLIAQALVESGRPCSALLICGAVESRNFSVPRGMDFLSLPALSKDSHGRYRARRLDCDLDEIIALRAATISGALLSYRPDVLIVDNVPQGAQGELVQTLSALQRIGETRFVLGLRDILDDPAAIQAEWQRTGSAHLLASIYDAIWVYGDRNVFDPLEQYGMLAPYSSRIRFTGYLDQRQRRDADDPETDALIADLDDRQQRLALCAVGGGQDGAELAAAFAGSRFPADMHGVLLTGPYMPEADMTRLRAIESQRTDLTVIEFLAEPAPLIRRADRVISMGGYNTTCELLSHEKTALIVPRVAPRQEQWIRASRLRDLGLLDILHPDGLSPRALSDWLADGGVGRKPDALAIDLDGLVRLPDLLDEAIASANGPLHQPAVARLP